MNWDQIEGKWTEFTGKAKAQWGKLTDDELAEVDGNREALAGKIQAQYGKTKEEAEQEIDNWLDKN
ncbi:CsbD family protein [Pararhizobium sp. IMCC21322]|uniref:CsbD family protein n=1 Tax=Pararhizobium sp. IMCC21322 TaxID=3067903 RepID=UPI0027407A02|nr:CsbD family protein [Pararhizobium sp. IMCC21322]